MRPILLRSKHTALKPYASRGFTLLEVVIALALLGFTMVLCISLAESNLKDGRLNVVGQQAATFGNALQRYLSDNGSTVAGVATATTPALITVNTLTAAGYMTAGFSATNSYQQTLCALVLQPAAGQLNAVVISEGGTALNDADLGAVVGAMGAAGGGIYSTSTSTMAGAQGGYSLAVGNYASANSAGTHCNGSAGAVSFAAGHLVEVLWYTSYNSTAGLLYRNSVPGQPQLNTMNTPIIMNTTQTAGSACSSVGAFAQSANQTSLVICGSNNVWNTVGNSIAGITAGAACTQADQLGSDANNVAYVCNGSFWSPIQNFATYSTTAATPCAQNNQMATSVTTGEMLVCRNNVYVKLASLITSQPNGEVGEALVSADTFLAAPTCDWGGRVWGTFETIASTVDVSVTPPRETMKLAATYVTAPAAGWNFTFNLVDTSSGSVDASYQNIQEKFHYGCYY